jgi:hypothetical protein
MEEEEVLLEKYTQLIKRLKTLSDSDAVKEMMIFFTDYFAPLWVKLKHYVLSDMDVIRSDVNGQDTLRKMTQGDQKELGQLYHWNALDMSLRGLDRKKLQSFLSQFSSIIQKPILKKIKTIRKEEGRNKDKISNFSTIYRDRLMNVLLTYNKLLIALGIRRNNEQKTFDKKKMQKFRESDSYTKLVHYRDHLDDIKINVLWKNISVLYSFLGKGDPQIVRHEEFFKDLYRRQFQAYDMTLAEIYGAGKTDLEEGIQELKTALSKILDGLLEGNVTKIMEGLYTHIMNFS